MVAYNESVRIESFGGGIMRLAKVVLTALLCILLVLLAAAPEKTRTTNFELSSSAHERLVQSFERGN